MVGYGFLGSRRFPLPRPGRRLHGRGRARLAGARLPGVPALWDPGPRLRPGPLRRLRPRAPDRLQVQGPGRLPFLQRSTHGRSRRASHRPGIPLASRPGHRLREQVVGSSRCPAAPALPASQLRGCRWRAPRLPARHPLDAPIGQPRRATSAACSAISGATSSSTSPRQVTCSPGRVREAFPSTPRCGSRERTAAASSASCAGTDAERWSRRPPFALERLHATGGLASLSSPDARLRAQAIARSAPPRAGHRPGHAHTSRPASPASAYRPGPRPASRRLPPGSDAGFDPTEPDPVPELVFDQSLPEAWED